MKFFKSNLLNALERVFQKAKSLVRNDGLVLEKPGKTDGSYIVAGSANRILSTSSGRGGSFKWDRSCVNSSTKICLHIIAVAEKRRKLQKFVESFRRSKCSASVSVLAVNGPSKSMESKGNDIKRSNEKRVDIEEVENIFAKNEIENSPNNANGQNEKAINEKHLSFKFQIPFS